MSQLISVNNKEYWESRKRPGEELMQTGFVMAEGFEKTIVLLSRIAEQFDEAVFSGKDFRFELRWDRKANCVRRLTLLFMDFLLIPIALAAVSSLMPFS